MEWGSPILHAGGNGSHLSPLSFLRVEGEDAFPVVLHTDDDPTLLFRLVVQRLGEGPDPGVGQPRGGGGPRGLYANWPDGYEDERAAP